MFALLKSVMIATLVVTLYYSFTLLPAFFILFVMWSDRRDGVDTDALIAAARHHKFSSPALLLPGFHAAVTAANDTSGYYNRKGRRGVYDALVDIGECMHENEQTLLRLFPRLQGSIDWLDSEISVSRKTPTYPTYNLPTINPPASVSKPLAIILSQFIEPLETLWRKNDFLHGGENVPDTLSVTMLMALSNWEALVMEAHLALVNLERVLDKYLSVVEAFADKAPQRLSQIIRSLHKLVGEMERVPKRATSAFMVSTDAEVTMLKVTVEEVKEPLELKIFQDPSSLISISYISPLLSVVLDGAGAYTVTVFASAEPLKNPAALFAPEEIDVTVPFNVQLNIATGL
ncbi:hypothetical protein EDD85DRAFT_799010 [Armillaria nabsnona]|nr:hypothetical protein EDD85DRAFT_799010 [Armillaria nabsnona]